nr:retrovirus-related Pol polyprotein from transposon TNT 1-94 [Tanacetum cinerariifolium]
ENLGKLQPKVDIGIFIGYAPTKKALWICNQPTRRIIETIHEDFDEQTVMTSEHSSSEPALHEMTHATISSGLEPNPPSLTPFIPPSRTDWDLLFQPLFDELLNPPPSIDFPAPKVIALIAEVVAPEPTASTGSPSSTIVDQDAPSPRNNLLLVQIYVDDIIFASTNTAMCNEFSNLMTTKFKMSMMGQMPFFLGLQISQSPRGIFINQSKYASKVVKKYGMLSSDSVDTPLIEKSKLDEDLQGKPVDATLYRGIIRSLMYLTSSRLDVTYVVCLCARYQAKPIEKHLNAVKQILRYLKEQVKNGIVELYFVRTEYQLADIFTKPLPRERFYFLIERLEMKSMSLDTLKHLAEETDE